MVIRIGTSGWSYDHWHPELYPPGLAPRDRLGRYAAAFPTAELPPSLPRDDARLGYFLGLVPGWMRVAVEFRHRSWHC